MTDLATVDLIERAIREDLGSGDVTTEACVPPDLQGRAVLSAQASGVLSGIEVVERLVEHVCQVKGQRCQVVVDKRDGDQVSNGDGILALTGHLQAILIAERPMLNFVQHLSGIATLTRRFADAVAGTGARILDTRKTTPGMRLLEKAAVVHGGGCNHRIGLFDGVLIKDNHIAAAGGIAEAVKRARAASHSLKLEVECESLEQVDEALDSDADMLLLDNMARHELQRVVRRVKQRLYVDPVPDDVKRIMSDRVVLKELWITGRETGDRVLLEASGTITLDRVRAVAKTGVDFISVGAITHSAPILPMHLEVK